LVMYSYLVTSMPLNEILDLFLQIEILQLKIFGAISGVVYHVISTIQN